MVLPKLEAQGVKDIIFEGVQLTPKNISKYLKNSQNKLIIIKSNRERLLKNRDKLFGNNQTMINRYNLDRIMLVQEEIIKQTLKLERDKFFIAENNNDYLETVKSILKYLEEYGIVRAKRF